jgi:creatinine amidohydrolase
MALFPDEVRPDLAAAGTPSVFGGLPFQTSSVATFEGVPVHLYLDFDEVTANGVMGDPKVSSAEVGRKLLDRVVEIGSKFVQQFATIPTRLEGPEGPRAVRSE